MWLLLCSPQPQSPNKALSKKVFLVEILWALFQFQCREMKADIWLPDSFSILIHFKIQQWSRLCQGGKTPPLSSILLQQAKNVEFYFFFFFLHFQTHSTEQNNIRLFNTLSALQARDFSVFLNGGAEVTGDLSGRPRVPKVPPPLCLSCFHAMNSQVHFLYTSAAVARYNCVPLDTAGAFANF